MVNQIYLNPSLVQEQPADFSAFWDHVREVWDSHDKALKQLSRTEKAGLRNLITSMISTDKNNVFSPCTLFLALTFLADLCGSETKAEILSAIFCNNAVTHEVAATLRNSIVGDSGISSCSVSNSLWINDNAPLHIDVIRKHCKEHNADAYSGTMGSTEMNTEMQAWVNKHTGHMLTNYSSDISTDSMSMLELLTTSYLKTDWDKKFRSKFTKKDRFYINDTHNVTCEFMNGTEQTLCLCSQQYTAVSKALQLDYRMWFIMPNSGVSLGNLLGSTSIHKLLTSPSELPLELFEVSMSIPKFDISSKCDLKRILQAMGIKSVFDERVADFTPISTDPHVCLGKAEHASRVRIMEDGVEAASYVDLGIACAGMPPKIKQMNFSLNKPFLFAISKSGTVPLYIGTVVNPLEH